jgi:predicted GIY-YIG superfamily endonuclease
MGHVNEDAIDWFTTIYHNIWPSLGEDEKEVTLKSGAKIELYSVKRRGDTRGQAPPVKIITATSKLASQADVDNIAMEFGTTRNAEEGATFILPNGTMLKQPEGRGRIWEHSMYGEPFGWGFREVFNKTESVAIRLDEKSLYISLNENIKPTRAQLATIGRIIQQSGVEYVAADMIRGSVADNVVTRYEDVRPHEVVQAIEAAYSKAGKTSTWKEAIATALQNVIEDEEAEIKILPKGTATPDTADSYRCFLAPNGDMICADVDEHRNVAHLYGNGNIRVGAANAYEIDELPTEQQRAEMARLIKANRSQIVFWDISNFASSEDNRSNSQGRIGDFFRAIDSICGNAKSAGGEGDAVSQMFWTNPNAFDITSASTTTKQSNIERLVAYKIITVEPVPKRIFEEDGWVLKDGTVLVKEYSNIAHAGIAQELGYKSAQEMVEDGAIAVVGGTYNVSLWFYKFDADTKSLLRDLAAQIPQKPQGISLSWGLRGETYERFKTGDDLLDWLDRATVGKTSALTSADKEFIEQLGNRVVDEKEVGDYDLALIESTLIPDFFQLGIQRRGFSMADPRQQMEKQPIGEIKPGWRQQVKDIMAVINGWLADHERLYAASHSPEKTAQYMSLLRRLGYNVGEQHIEFHGLELDVPYISKTAKLGHWLLTADSPQLTPHRYEEFEQSTNGWALQEDRREGEFGLDMPSLADLAPGHDPENLDTVDDPYDLGVPRGSGTQYHVRSHWLLQGASQSHQGSKLTDMGWITTDGKYHACHQGESHTDLAIRLGLVEVDQESEPEDRGSDDWGAWVSGVESVVLAAGNIRVTGYPGVAFEARDFDEITRKNIADTIRANKGIVSVSIEFFDPTYVDVDKLTPDEAIQWMVTGKKPVKTDVRKWRESSQKTAGAYSLYHGTGSDFDKFESGHFNGWSRQRGGFYFTDDIEAAKEFASGGYLIQADVTITHPLDLRQEWKNPDFEKVLAILTPEYQEKIKTGPYSSMVSNATARGLAQTPEFLKAVQGAGFDGIIMPDRLGHGSWFDSYIVFNPSQIKIKNKEPHTAAVRPKGENYIIEIYKKRWYYLVMSAGTIYHIDQLVNSTLHGPFASREEAKNALSEDPAGKLGYVYFSEAMIPTTIEDILKELTKTAIPVQIKMFANKEAASYPKGMSYIVEIFEGRWYYFTMPVGDINDLNLLADVKLHGPFATQWDAKNTMWSESKEYSSRIGLLHFFYTDIAEKALAILQGLAPKAIPAQIKMFAKVAAEDVPGFVYLIHTTKPFHHLRHYLGWTQNLDERLEEHRRGTGANIMRVLKEQGIEWKLARTWKNVTRKFERRLKNQGGLSRHCPICKAQGLICPSRARPKALETPEGVGYIETCDPKTAAGKRLYHATAAKNIPSIAKHGLTPSEEPNWGGLLGEESYGRVYFAPTPRAAMYYATIIFREKLGNDDVASAPICLRIRIPKGTSVENSEHEKARKKNPLLPARPEESWATTAIPPQNIEVWWQNKWHPIQQVANHDWESYTYQYSENEGIYTDWEGATVGDTTGDAVDDATKFFTPKTAAKRYSAKQVIEYTKSVQTYEDPFAANEIMKYPAWGLKEVSVANLKGCKLSEGDEPYLGVEYAKLKTPFPPVVLDESGTPIDGLHRCYAAILRGDEKIWAFVPIARRNASKLGSLEFLPRITAVKAFSEDEMLKFAHWLLLATNYEDMFKQLLAVYPNFKPDVDREIQWAKTVLKKADRIIWYLRWWRLKQEELFVGLLDPKVKNLEQSKKVVNLFKKDIAAYNAKSKVKITEQDIEALDPRELKPQLEHFFSLEDPAIQGIQFGFETPTAVVAELTNLEEEIRVKLESQTRIVPEPTKEGDKVFIKFGNGWAWWALSRGYCSEEAKAMGHCGNQGQVTGDQIISLREPRQKRGQTYWEPHLTFIFDKTTGLLGEMKGRGNEKPAARYHPYIITLLKDERIKGIRGGGYEPSHNFNMNDLPEDVRTGLEDEKPALMTLRRYIEKKYGKPIIKDQRPQYAYKGVMDKLMADPLVTNKVGDLLGLGAFTKSEAKLGGWVLHTWKNAADFVADKGDKQAQWLAKYTIEGEFLDWDAGERDSDVVLLLDDLPTAVMNNIGLTLEYEYPDELLDFISEQGGSDEFTWEPDQVDDVKDFLMFLEQDQGISTDVMSNLHTAHRFGSEAGVSDQMYVDLKTGIKDASDDNDRVEITFPDGDIWDGRISAVLKFPEALATAIEYEDEGGFTNDPYEDTFATTLLETLGTRVRERDYGDFNQDVALEHLKDEYSKPPVKVKKPVKGQEELFPDAVVTEH